MNYLELKPSNQTKLFGYENSFSKIATLFNEKKLPNKILFTGSKGVGKATFAYHLINYIFSKDEKFNYDLTNFQINSENKSYKLVLSNSHPNFFLIDLLHEKKMIEISQIRDMIKYSNKSAFNNKERIVLIDNAENLNLNSSSALLKIIEEPNENLLFILIFDNNKNLLETIKSRCIKFNFFLPFNESVKITNNIIEENLYDQLNNDIINYYNTVGDFINLIKFSKTFKINLSETTFNDFLISLIENKYYKKDIFIKDSIYKYVEFYLLKLINLNRSNKKIINLYENFIKKIHFIKKFNLDDESFFIELRSKVLNG